MLFTAAIALIDSLYLLYIHYYPLIPDQALYALCSSGNVFDCNTVNTSAYSVLFGLPLSAWGVAFYLIFIFLVLYNTKHHEHTISDFIILWSAIFAVLLSCVLGFISFVTIKKFCSFCMVLWACNIVLLICVLLQIRHMYNGILKGINIIHDFDVMQIMKNRSVQKFFFITLIIACISLGIGYGLHAGLQYTYTKKEEQRHAKLTEEFKKEYDTYKKITIAVDNIKPVVGKKENPVHIVVFFDFNCGACHRAIIMLHELALKYPETIALYLRHFPLDGQCNRFIKSKHDGSSCIASAIAYSLYGSGSYHDYIMELMSHQGKVDTEVIQSVVDRLKYNYYQLSQKAKTKEIINYLQEDIALGETLGVYATPTIIINNTMLKPGIPPAYIMEMAIKIEMEKSNSKLQLTDYTNSL